MDHRTLLRLASLLRRFLVRTEGQVAIIFSLCLVPVAFLAGAALDYSGASDLQARLQRATDSANLQLCQMSGTPTQDQLNQAAQTYMTGLMSGTGTGFSVDNVIYTPSPRRIQLVTSAQFPTAVVRAFSERFRYMPVDATSQCFGQPQTFEIALVLDNTYSMLESSGGQSKMAALKTAATNFINYVFTNDILKSSTKISLVPFAASVAVSPTTYRSASWIDQNGKASNHWSFLQHGAADAAAAFTPLNIKNRLDLFTYIKGTVPSVDWAGCFESLPYPLNVQDVSPTPSNLDSYYVPMFGPDESGPAGAQTHTVGQSQVVVGSENSWADETGGSCPTTTDETTLMGEVCKYKPVTNYKTVFNLFTYTSPNAACTTRPLTRLTTDKTTLISEINAMQPLGTTDIHEGFMWGWRTLSPNSVLADGASYSKAFNNKIMIVMTDGMNTWFPNPYNNVLQSTYSAYGYIKNPDGSNPYARLPPANANLNSSDGTKTRAAIDALTLQSCQNARNAGVTIYTIGFSVASDPIDAQGISMLQTCAGSSSRAFVANDSNGIVSVFQQIAATIGNLKLTQ